MIKINYFSIIFVKELATHILEFYNTFILIAFDFMHLPKPPGFKYPMLYISTYLYFINYIHVFAMAINRFYAIFFPEKYSIIWSKKWIYFINLKYNQFNILKKYNYNLHNCLDPWNCPWLTSSCLFALQRQFISSFYGRYCSGHCNRWLHFCLWRNSHQIGTWKKY